MSKQHMFIR